jgi:hypothetical protein
MTADKEIRKILRPALRFRLLALLLTTGAVLAVIFNYVKILQAIGDAWPPEPDVRPQDAYRGSELRVPLKITNTSRFPIEDAVLTCGIELALFEDAKGKRFGVSEMAFTNARQTIPPGVTMDYQCDASYLARIDAGGRLSLRDELATQTGGFTNPVKILKMCVWVGGDYYTGPIPRSFTSQTYKWPATQNALQWAVGGLIRDPFAQQNPSKDDPDKLDCSVSPKGPYILFTGRGRPLLVLDILKRPR